MIDEKIIERVERWKNSLIDLTMRNRLINFKETKRSTLKILGPTFNSLYELIVDKSKEMIIKPNEFDNLNKQKTSKKHLIVNSTDKEYRLILNNLKRRAKTSIEEQGVNILFIAFGLLRWYEVEHSETSFFAPLILIPISLSKAGIDGDFSIKILDDEIVINPSICKKMEEFRINFPSFEEILEHFEKVESSKSLLEFAFTILNKKISHKERWMIKKECWISLFSFNKLAMYADLENAKNEEFLQNNRVIRAIATGSYIDETCENIDIESQKLDDIFVPDKTFQILDADSSQLEAIAAVNNGYDIVIEGPPGTGKSQTIANIIAESLANEKTVLFVSEKMAALDVVKKRLDENGLGNFVLELHSKKTGKRAVLNELDRVIKNVQKINIPEMNKDLMNLDNHKNRLNLYVNSLHKKRGKMNLSAYQVYGKLLELRNVEDIDYNFKNVSEFTSEKFEAIKNNLQIIKNYETFLIDPDNFELDKIKIESFNHSLSRELRNLIEKQLTIIEKIESLANKGAYSIWNKIVKECKDFFRDNKFKKRDYRKISSEIGKLINFLDDHRVYFSKENSSSFFSLQEISFNLKKEIDEYNEIMKKITKPHNTNLAIDYEAAQKKLISVFEKYKANIFDLNTNELISKWKKYNSFFGRLFGGYRNNINKIKQLSRNGEICKNILSDLETIDYIKDRYKIEPGMIDEQVISKKSQELLEKLTTISEYMDLFGENVQRFSNLIEGIENYLAIMKSQKERFGEIKEITNGELIDFIAINKELFNILTKSESLIDYGLNFKNYRLNDLYLLKFLLLKIKRAIPNIEEWFQVKEIISDLRDDGVSSFFYKYLKIKKTTIHIVESFEKSFLLSYLDFLLYESKELRRFEGNVYEGIINNFRELDVKQREYSKYRIQNILYKNFPKPGIIKKTNNSEISILMREIQKKKRNLPLRKLFLAIPNLLKTLKPCLMMSPLSISYFIDIKGLKFDLVIFDEASQVFPEDAIGAIMRSKQTVIVGDTKQLPPTSFFKSVDLDKPEEEDSVNYLDNLESILSECLATAMPSKTLKWHYRSRKESLIAFSNYHFYNNELYTFPENNGNHKGINHIYVENGVYDRGKSRRNIEEANKVAQLVIQHAKEKPDVSLGVVALSEAQQNAIIDKIEELRRENPELETFFREDKFESFFVKNLESVQGDERDEIIFSVGYGKDYAGKLNMNFGPINKEGGERRLNVAITRSRQKVTIVSSIRSDEMHFDGKSIGARVLKEYLKYAENNGNKTSLISETREDLGDFDSVFEKEVHNMLKQKGYEVHKQVGCSGYRIDLGVLHPDRPGRYLAGIECDGATYHSAKTARDRDRLRQQILEGLGWKIIRIWSRDWYKNPEKEMEKLIKKLESLRNKSETTDNSIDILIKKNDVIKVEKIKQTSSEKEYRDYEKFDINKLDEYLSHIPNLTPKQLLLRILETEAPIHLKECMKRYKEMFEYVKLCARKILYNFEEVMTNKMNLSYNSFNKLVESTLYENYNKYEIKEDFIYKQLNGQFKPRKFQPEVKIKSEYIPPKDIRGFIRIVLKNSYGINIDDLAVEVCGMLGFSRLGENLKKVINDQIRSMLKEKKIYVKNEKYFLS